MVALLLVPMIGFAAIALDVAGMWWQHQLLRNGADAGALAIAQDCAKNTTSCANRTATAQAMADLNVTGVSATAAVSSTSNSATVTTTATRDHVFAPILGVHSSTISAQARASWGAPSAGVSLLPLVFSWCEFSAHTNGGVPSSTTPYTIVMPKTSTSACNGPSGNPIPGGFGWIEADAGGCTADNAVSQTANSDPGNSVPSGCSTAGFGALLNKPVLVPIYDTATGTGSGGTYRIYGFAAFTLTGYHFGGQYSFNRGCSGSARCITGYFTRFVDLSERFTYSASAPDLGAHIIHLSAV